MSALNRSYGLHLEVNETTVDKTAHIGGVMLTPAPTKDYWLFRVRLTDRQAVLGFPKFGTIGIGFAQEDDWNTNLPFSCIAQEIYDHIEYNRGDAHNVPKSDVLKAIEMVQEAAERYMTAKRGVAEVEAMKGRNRSHLKGNRAS